jgi:hypothetical protein
MDSPVDPVTGKPIRLAIGQRFCKGCGKRSITHDYCGQCRRVACVVCRHKFTKQSPAQKKCPKCRNNLVT